jgi:hypothetical protein
MNPMPRSHRPVIMGRNGAVGTNHPLATQAGLDMLWAGDDAADAAVAVSLALGVVEPMMSGLVKSSLEFRSLSSFRVCFAGTANACNAT